MNIREGILNLMAIMPAAIITVCLPLGIYWTFQKTPIRLIYASPNLLKQPVKTIEEVDANAVTETVGGRDLYRLIIYCVDKPYRGTIRRAWVNDSVIRHAPDRSTMLSDRVGCETVSTRIPVPLSNPSESFELLQVVDVYVNPIRTDKIEFQPVNIKILKAD